MDIPQRSGVTQAPDGNPELAEQVTEARDWTWLARIRRPQGRKGELLAEVLTDFPDKFAERRSLWLLREDPSPAATSFSPALPRPVVLLNHWRHKGGVVLHFEGVNTINDAEQLNGSIVTIPREERTPLAEDEAYIGDLIGCAVVDLAQGEPVSVGTIEDMDRSSGPVPLLVVRKANGAEDDEILIPFAKSYLRKIDLEAKRVEMLLPVGLVDLDEAEEA